MGQWLHRNDLKKLGSLPIQLLALFVQTFESDAAAWVQADTSVENQDRILILVFCL